MKNISDIQGRKEFGGGIHGLDLSYHVINNNGESPHYHTCYDYYPNDVYAGTMWRQPTSGGGKWPGGYYYYGFITCIWH